MKKNSTKSKVKQGYYYPNSMTRWSYFMQAIEPVSDVINEAFPQYHPMWIIRSQAKTVNSINFKYLRQYILGITQKQCAAYLRVSVSVVGKWESGKSQVPFVVYELLRLLSESVHFKLSNHEWQGWFIGLDGRLVSPDRGNLSFTRHELSFVREVHASKSYFETQYHKMCEELAPLKAEIEAFKNIFGNDGLLSELQAMQSRLSEISMHLSDNKVVSINSKLKQELTFTEAKTA